MHAHTHTHTPKFARCESTFLVQRAKERVRQADREVARSIIIAFLDQKNEKMQAMQTIITGLDQIMR